jgi:hypothetical protein
VGQAAPAAKALLSPGAEVAVEVEEGKSNNKCARRGAAAPAVVAPPPLVASCQRIDGKTTLRDLFTAMDPAKHFKPETVEKCEALLEKADVFLVSELAELMEVQLSNAFADAMVGMQLYLKKLLERARAEVVP